MSINITKTKGFYIVKDDALLAVPLEQLPQPNKQVLVETRNDQGVLTRKYSTVIKMDDTISNSNPITGVNLTGNIICQCQQGYILDRVEAFLRLSSYYIEMNSHDVVTIYDRNNNTLAKAGISFGAQTEVDGQRGYSDLKYYIKDSTGSAVAHGTLNYADVFPYKASIYSLNNTQKQEVLTQYGNLYYDLSSDRTPYLRVLMDTAVEEGKYKLYITLQMVMPLQTANGLWLPYTEQTSGYDTYEKGTKQFYSSSESADLTQITSNAEDTRWYRRWMRRNAIDSNSPSTISAVTDQELKVLNIGDLATTAPYGVSVYQQSSIMRPNDLHHNPSLFVTTRPLPGVYVK